jgi:hypothetical protein
MPDAFDVFVQYEAGGPPLFFASNTFIEATGAGASSAARQREDQDLLRIGKPITVDEKQTTAAILGKFIEDSILGSKDAERRMLILSGHGSGAVGDFLTGDVQGARLTIPSLGKLLYEVKQKVAQKIDLPKDKKLIDILGMDSCLMSMAEVAYEVRENVDCMVAAEGFELNTGWPYARLLELAKGEIGGLRALERSTEELAKGIVRAYVDYYRNYELADVSTDLSALNLKQDLLDGLVNAVKELSTVMIPALNNQQARDSIIMAHWEAQSYKNDQHVDLFDFCDLLKDRYQDFKDPCQNVISAIKKVRLLSCTTGAAFQHSQGISVFFPWANIQDIDGVRELTIYEGLSWPDRSGWAMFLDQYVSRTQRLPAGCESVEQLTTDEKLPPKQQRFRRSRLNRRFGYFRANAGGHRWDPPESKWDPPESKFGGGGGGKIGNIKNPPIYWMSRSCE